MNFIEKLFDMVAWGEDEEWQRPGREVFALVAKEARPMLLKSMGMDDQYVVRPDYDTVIASIRRSNYLLRLECPIACARAWLLYVLKTKNRILQETPNIDLLHARY